MQPEQPEHLEIPQPSAWPIALAFGLLLVAIGVVSTIVISVWGLIVVLVCVVGWTMENREQGGQEEAEND